MQTDKIKLWNTNPTKNYIEKLEENFLEQEL